MAGGVIPGLRERLRLDGEEFRQPLPYGEVCGMAFLNLALRLRPIGTGAQFSSYKMHLS